jgi:glyoxylase-like metal-dependent hydrolase (beta-lactamase superfamily II)
MADFAEVAPRVWVARHEWMDVNVTLVGGDRGLLLVDTHSSGLAARGVVEDVRRLGAGEVLAVVNTHEHWDHTFGNAEVRAAYGPVPIHAHEWAAEHTVEAGERVQSRFADSDDDALLAGDLVEESGPPAYGSDSWPLEWPLSLDIVLGLSTSSSVVVPGHGAPVGRDFVEEQRNAIGIVAETIRDLAGRGVPLAQAVEAAAWPFPPGSLTHAVARGYQQLPRSQKRLPLI